VEYLRPVGNSGAFVSDVNKIKLPPRKDILLLWGIGSGNRPK
jgi:hypothetical protein